MTVSQDKGLEHLELWQVAIAFSQKVYQEVVPVLPLEEKWVMVTQLGRAAQSISANITEGYGRYYYQDNVRSCYFALGSLEETFSYLTLANRLEYQPADLFSSLIIDVNRLRRLINGYIAFLKASKRGATEPGAGLSIREGSDNYQFNEPSETDPNHQLPITNHASRIFGGYDESPNLMGKRLC